MSNLASQNDVLNFVSNKVSSSNNSSGKVSNKTSSDASESKNLAEDDRESFLNSLLNSIDETNEFLPDHMKISEKEVINEAMNKLQKGVFDESDKISIFESASFMQILSLLDKIKADTADIKFANLSTKLSDFIKTEANFSALKGAKNLSELLDIAKDLGLNVKNIKVDRLLDLKATFPNLDKADFFKGAVDNVFKEIINNKLAHVSKNLNQNLQNVNHTPHTHFNQNSKNAKSKDDVSLLSQTLKNLDSILSSKNEKADKIKAKNDDEVIDLKNTLKSLKNEDHAKEISTEILTAKDKKSSNQDIQIQNKDNIKEIKNTSLSDLIKQEDQENKDLKNANHLQGKLSNIKDNKELIKKQDENNQTQESMKEQAKTAKNENLNMALDKNINKELIKDSQNLSSNFTQKEMNLNKENKTSKDNIKDIKQNFADQKVNFENLNKTQFVSNKDNTNFNNYLNKENLTQDQAKTHSENSEKNTLDELNSLVKDLNKISQNNTKNITPKETLQHFSQDLKEAIDQYKAPITKLSITLNPNNLGEVEVTLVQRGNNLHINFNSNTNAMNLFIQNQAEFKNSLVNMGFTGLEMNFSDQGKREQNQNQGKNRSGYGFKDVIEDKNEGEKINLELVLAKYF